MRKLLLAGLLLTFAFLNSPAHAWWNDTHAEMMWKACSDFNCPLTYNQVFEWSNYPDDVLQDYEQHRCLWKDCPAMANTNARLLKAKNYEGNARWQEIAIASHYFFDSKNTMHQVPSNTINIQACEKEFESKTNEKIIAKEKNWTVEACEVRVSDAELEQFIEEFESMIEQKVGVQQAKNAPLYYRCGIFCRLLEFVKFWLGKEKEVLQETFTAQDA